MNNSVESCSKYKGFNATAGTLCDVLRNTAAAFPRKGVTHLLPADASEDFQSYSDLLKQAEGVAQVLCTKGLQPGAHLIFLVDSSRSFLTTFWGCVLAGVIPAPLAPPAGSNPDSLEAQKILNVWKVLKCPVLCDTRHGELYGLLGTLLGPAGQLYCAEELLSEAEISPAQPRELPRVAPDDTVILQFSSGSTGMPKGALLSHTNLLSNARAMAAGVHATDADVLMAWLPYFHDYGLFGSHLMPLMAGMNQIKMAPQHFARRPYLWLEKIHQHRATFTCTTNTGLEYLLKYLQAKKGRGTPIDLSCLKGFSVGAEMVSAASCRELAEVLAPSGLKPNIFVPGYGLTETTMVAAAHTLGEPVRAVRVDRQRMVREGLITYRQDDGADVAEFACIGPAVDECAVRVVGADGQSLPPDRVGVIEVRGQNVFRAYYNAEGDAVRPDGWFSTGDMGFLDSEQRLTITGRAKEMILIHGQNYYPYDIEQIALRGAPEDKLRLIVVCGFYDPRVARELVVLFYVPHQLSDENAAPLLLEMSNRVNDLAGFPINHFIPLTQREIPRTTSGKVMRRELAEQFLSGAFDAARARLDALLQQKRAAAPATGLDVEQVVRAIWVETLDVPPEQLTPSVGLFQLGGESIKAMRIQARLETAFNTRLESNFCYSRQLLRQQIQYFQQMDRSVEPPRTEFESILRSVAADVLSHKPETLGVTDELVSKARKLSDILKLQSEIKRVFGLQEFPEGFLDLRTIREMAASLWKDLIEQKRSTSAGDQPFPLMNFQETLYFHRRGIVRNEPSGLSCYIFLRLDVQGELRKDALDRAFEQVVRRHAILRAVVDEEVDRPRFRILPEVSAFHSSFYDLRHLSAAEQETFLTDKGRELNDHRFPIDEQPMFLCEVYQVGEQAYTFMFNIDHLLVDGYSFMQLINELFTTYEALGTDEASMPPLQTEFRDYVLIEAIRQRTPEYRKAMEFQLEVFRSPPPKANPPMKRNPATLPEVQFDTCYRRIPEETFRTLFRLCGEHEVSINSLLLAAYFKLMNIWCRQDELIINMPVFNREQYFSGAREVLGSFIDIFPVLLRTSHEEPIIDMARRVEGFTRQLLKVPVSSIELSRLIAERAQKPATSLSSLIFSNSIGVHSKDTRTVQRLKVSRPEFRTGAPGTYIDLVLYDFHGEYCLNWNYVRSLFDPAFIDTLAWQYETLLRQLCTQLESGQLGAPFTGAGLMTPRHAKLLADLNRTKAPYPSTTTLHELVADVAERMPDRLALTFKDESLTHQQLQLRARRVAHLLRELGVRPGQFVALMLQRSTDLLVAQLGILLAGGAYVPLDTEYPAERLEYVLQDCQAKVLITGARHLPAVQGRQNHLENILLIDTDPPTSGSEKSGPARVLYRDALSRYAETALTRGAGAEDPAYMIYTSGSTGKPKGVVVRHRNILNFLHWVREEFRIGPDERFAFVTSYAFDMTLTSNWVPFLTGASLHVLSEDDTRDVLTLLQFIRDREITFLNVTPSHFSLLSNARAFMLEAPLPLVPRMRIMLGGEVINVKDLDLWLQHYPEHRFINEYGPTETSVASSFFPIPVAETGRVELETVPIGKPVFNTQLYVIDKSGNLCMPGVYGELCIGGEGVTVGYFNKPGRTAESFVPDPFVGNGQLMYRTGDMARVLDDGNIEFLGREDYQINLRGYRIEAGEVENAIREFESIAEVVVTTRADTAGKLALVAFYTAIKGQVSAQELREFLRNKLPAHMVPAHFAYLERMPTTASGKLDYKRLPELRIEVASTSVNYKAPDTELERKLAALWEEVLGVSRPGIHDNFWEVGGDSLKAMRLILRMKEQGFSGFGLREAFHYQTISAMAKLITGRQQEGQAASAPAGQPEELCTRLRKPAAPRVRLLCVPYACGNATAFVELSRYMPDDVELVAANVSPLSGGGNHSITHWAETLQRTLRDAPSSVPTVLLGYSYGAHVVVELAHQLEKAGTPVAGLALVSACPPGVTRELKMVVSASSEDIKDYLHRVYQTDFTGWLEEEGQRYIQLLKQQSAAMMDYRFPQAPLETPTLLLVGRNEEDKEAVLGMPALARCFTRSQTEELPGGHMLIRTHPAMLAERTAAFLRELVPAARRTA